jgi:hypothetical protein
MRANSSAQRMRAGERAGRWAGSPAGSGAGESGVAGRARAVSLKRAAASSQHAVIAVAVQAWGRDQCGQTLDQFQGREAQLGAPIGLGLGEAIDELVVGELLEPLQREGRASTIAQQPLQPGPIRPRDAHRGIE